MPYLGKQPARTPIDASDIPDDSITAAKIVDGTIVAADIATGAVDTAELAADAVTGAKIEDDAIDSEHIAADSIDAEHYAAGSVDTTALGADAVTGAKIADDAIDSEHIAADSIDAEHYAAGSVDSTAIANDAIDSQHIAADSIDAEHYAAGSVDTTALGADSVTAAKIGDNVIDSEHYAAGSIDNEHLADDAVGVAELSATGTASSSTFLRGDNAWASAGVSTLAALTDSTVSASNPDIDENPSGIGHLWLNSTTGDTFVCSDASTDANKWLNTGTGSGDIIPQTAIMAGGDVDIQKITITSTGNAVEWGGNLELASKDFNSPSSVSNGSNGRAVFGLAQITDTGYSNVMHYLTIASPGNSIDFGDMHANSRADKGVGASNGTNNRGTFGGGYCASSCGGGGMVDDISYITISSAGNAAGHGNLTIDVAGARAVSNSTSDRAVQAGGATEPSGWSPTNVMGYFTISGTSGASDFGDLSTSSRPGAAASNGTSDRGVWFGCDGNDAVDYVTISSTSNASDWGDVIATGKASAATSNGSGDRCVYLGGTTIEYMTVSSTGSAADFGDALATHGKEEMTSDSFG